MWYNFKENFLWGAACSGPQSEGSKGKQAQSIWEYDSVKSPEKFFNQVNNLIASNFYENYKECIALMKQVGLNSYRTSIQWTRLINDRNGSVNQEGIQFYHDMIDELIRNDIEPMMCLFHFDMPMYWMEKGGFENRDTLDAFADFAELCFREYGDKINYWSTFNEPVIIPELGYLYKAHYPEVQDMKRAIQVGYHVQLASCKAIERFRQVGSKGEIGVILNLTPSYAPENATAEDIAACKVSDLLFNRSYLDPAVKGAYPSELIEFLKKENLMPVVEAGDADLIKENTIDYLGVNYYAPRRIKAKTSAVGSVQMPEDYFDYYTFEGQKMNHYRGWEIYEPALYDIAVNIRDNYNNIKWYVAENGMGVEGEERFRNEQGIVQDDYRIDFIKDHLSYLHKGITEGSNCFGYHLWCPFDSWSWRNAYKNRYGFIGVDLDNHCALHIKKSGRWHKTLSTQNGFERSNDDDKDANKKRI